MSPSHKSRIWTVHMSFNTWKPASLAYSRRQTTKKQRVQFSCGLWLGIMENVEESYTRDGGRISLRNVRIYQITRRHNLEDSNLHNHHCDNLKIHSLIMKIDAVFPLKRSIFTRQHGITAQKNLQFSLISGALSLSWWRLEFGSYNITVKLVKAERE
jgi:hypothetical protein